MDFLKSAFLLLSTLLFLNNCASLKLEMSFYQREWTLIKFKNYSKEFLVEKKAHLNLFPKHESKNQHTAFMGCNQIFFNAEFNKNGKVKFSDIGRSLMYCKNEMKLENKFAEALPNMKNYKIEGHFLTLSDEEGNAMKFVAADWD